jgi:replicative superfamily II helicase
MVDFNKLREEKKHSTPIDPLEIFRRLPKPESINDLYVSQAETLRAWFDRREEESLVVKLHTGGGKTLVGLLIAQSCLNETRAPVLYLCPNRQLVDQTYRKSLEYGIPAIPYQPGGKENLPDEFIASKKVLICTYNALFNGKSKFGIVGSGRPPIKVGTIILDDAHVAYSQIRDAYTLRIEKEKSEEDFSHLTNIFKKDLDDVGKGGLYNDIITGKEAYSVLEIPYWSWFDHLHEVREYIRGTADVSHPFVWPFIRDHLEYSHVLVSKNAFVITPYFPLVDLIPTFTNAPRKIFMSATIADDSSIIRTFGADQSSVRQPLTSNSLAGVSERLILMPEWTAIVDDHKKLLKKVAKWTANTIKVGTVILAPSDYISEGWSDIGEVATKEQVSEFVQSLQNGERTGPFVFSNRYDGIDLPGNACRLLILANMPRGTNEYENYLANLFDGSVLNNSLAQKIEQGLGRGARGSRDYCVVLIFGKDVLSWIASRSNSQFLTKITRAQIEMGQKISESIKNEHELAETLQKCLQRDPDWIGYHAETLAELTENDPVDIEQLLNATTEREAFGLWRDGNYEKAINKIVKYCEVRVAENEIKGWLLQLAARIAESWKNHELSVDLQKQAFSCSKNLFRPRIIEYVKLANPGKQAKEIVSQIQFYRTRRGHLSRFDEVVSHLVPEASSNQFEKALQDLGKILGFSTERPEKSYGKGPDVLWLLNGKTAWVIEAKSRKNKDNPLTKAQHGQLLNAEQWFLSEYPNMQPIRVSLSPTRMVTANTVAQGTKVLTFEKLNELLRNTRNLIAALCDSIKSDDELVILCEQLLSKHKLLPEKISDTFLQDSQQE